MRNVAAFEEIAQIQFSVLDLNRCRLHMLNTQEIKK